MSSLAPPLRSALKHSSRPGSPTSTPGSLSPQTPRMALPPYDPATPTGTWAHSPALTPTTMSRSQSLSSLAGAASNIGGGGGGASSTLSPTNGAPSSVAPSSASTAPTTTTGTHASTNYTSKVSFDTFENPVASMFSFTLQVKTEGYRRTRNTRVFLCASSPDESGREALDWCLEALVQDGDELIVFRGADEDVFEKDHNLVREEARGLMRSMQAKSLEYEPTRKLSLILEYIPGKVTDSIDRLIALYRPDSLVVGTRGRRLAGLAQGLSAGLLQGLGGGSSIGSVSKYCLSHSPVPVIVVRPGRKLRKAVEKRRADPKRGKHFE